LQVAVKASHRVDDAVNLFFSFGPKAGHRFAFTVEVGLHLREALDDGLDAVPEPRAGQVPVDHFHLGLLAFAS
jgi:hypothetical protein